MTYNNIGPLITHSDDGDGFASFLCFLLAERKPVVMSTSVDEHSCNVIVMHWKLQIAAKER